MKAVFKRELRSLLGGMRGWGYMAVVLLGTAVSVALTNISGATTRFELNIFYIALSMIPATAIAATDAFQAERRQNTERILYSLPLKNTSIVLGKMLALVVPVLITAAALCAFPLIMMPFGTVYLIPALAAILALAVLGVAMMAIGLLISACSPNRLVAAAGIIAALVFSWFVPYLSNLLRSSDQVTIPMMLSFMLAAFALTYLLSNNPYLGVIMAAIFEVPMLLAYLQGTGGDLMAVFAKGVDALNLFDGLNAYINGLLDGQALVCWLAAAALSVFSTVLCIANRRQAKRRAL